MLGLGDIQIPTLGWQEITPAEGARRWRNDAGDQLSLHFFGIPPDLPTGPHGLDALRQIYREALAQVGGIVEVDEVVVSGIQSVRSIFKIRQTPTGMTYLGSLTIPFRDCSFVIKWQCPEHGVTGIRDASVFAIVAPPIDEITGEPEGWQRTRTIPRLEPPRLELERTIPSGTRISRLIRCRVCARISLGLIVSISPTRRPRNRDARVREPLGLYNWPLQRTGSSSYARCSRR